MNHKDKQKKSFIFLCAFLLATGCRLGQPSLFSGEEFANPDIRWRPIPLWFWNDCEVSEAGIEAQLRGMIEKDGYGGCAILPFGAGFRPEYLSEEYFKLYGKAIDVVRSYGGQMSLYDEYGFPSGSMGAKHGDGIPRLANAHPGKTLKRLDKEEFETQVGEEFRLDLVQFEGKLMALDAVSFSDGSVIDLKGTLDGNVLSWTPRKDGAPWTVMAFFCRTDGDPNVDYLDPEAVKLFINGTHEEYYKRFGSDFGTTITSTFFDEPTMYRCEGRVWTDAFNERFRECYGDEADTLYPFLWYDLGEGTALARCKMFGLHSKLYAEGFMKEISEWSDAHGIVSTGHQDQEEVLNTTALSGDLMFCGKFMGGPGIDKIGGDRPAEHFYKVVSSSAYNWDHDMVMSETFGAMGNIPFETMYKTAIEQYSKGITNLIPHAVWYDDSKVSFLPELSFRNPVYSEGLPEFNLFLSRLRYVLDRRGRHVADIAVLYPVQTQYAGHHLDGELGRFAGGVRVECTDYDRVSQILTDSLGRDFTYLHPEVLGSRCSTDADGILTMHNEINTEHFNTLILPGVRVIDIEVLEKISKAASKGLNVIFTSQCPSVSASDNADDCMISGIVEEMLDSGLATFISVPTAEYINSALMSSLACADVLFEGGNQPFNVMHKVIDGAEIYYFGNIDDCASSNTVSLLGRKRGGKLMDPHTGEILPFKSEFSNGRTSFELALEPARSIFLVFE